MQTHPAAQTREKHSYQSSMPKRRATDANLSRELLLLKGSARSRGRAEQMLLRLSLEHLELGEERRVV
eukprot:2824044-Pleurochrysis_carterae.AAC.3